MWNNPLVRDVLGALSIFGAFLIVTLCVRLFWIRVLRAFTRRTKTELDDVILSALRRPVIFGLIAAGVCYALMSLSALAEYRETLNKVFLAAGIAIGLYAVLRVFNTVVGWYLRTAAEREELRPEVSHHASMARKIGNILVLAVGLLLVLRALNIDISPLLAGGAIGGLAVALALQDTLSNLFAGLYVTLDKPVSVGDFIKLESGEEGFVEEIGWRNTKVRLWANNVVVIPNSRLTQSVLTNYYLPKQEMSVYISCGVSYDSDLEHVERVAIEVGREVMSRVEGASDEWEPIVRFKEFGDFSINFVAVLRVKQFVAQYALHSEYVKTLHRRFQQEGIEIPFPIRTIIMKSPQHESPPLPKGM